MFINNLKLAFRHLLRQKLNTSLHIAGLTLGMSVCLLIALLIRYEVSFDNYHPKAENIYRINSVFIDAGRKNFTFSTPMPLADELRTGVSGLEAVTLAHPVWNTIVEITPEKRFKQDHMLIAEPDFLNIFAIEPIKGNAPDILRKPYHALLTESTAKKFYGDEDPIGKTFLFRNEFTITVGGIIKDLPANSHLPASMLLSYVPNEGYLDNGVDAWTYVSGTETLVRVPDNYNLADLEAYLARVAEKHLNADPTLSKVFRSEFEIQPLSTIHFDAGNGGSAWVQAVNENWLWFFAAIGLAVLVLACINFVNLSTAQALNRAKEVGVLKSIGAGRFHLMSQFLREAWILAFAAGILAVALTQIILPSMNTLLDKHITFNLLESPWLIGSLVVGIIVTGFLAGLYPAWIIARFNPAVTLKARSGVVGSYGSTWLRKALVVTQFTISAGLLVAVTLIAQQVNFMRSKNLGFDRDNIINVEILRGANTASVFGSELKKLPGIKDVSFATATPVSDGHWGTVMSRTNGDDPNRMPVNMILTDDNFSKMYDLKLLEGRFLQTGDTSFASQTLPRDERIMRVVVNETLVRALGFESNEKALHKRFWIGMNSGNAEIMGVVADFNTSSLHEAIKPVLLMLDYRQLSQAGIKIEAGTDIPQTIASIEKAWKKIYTDGVFQFKFLDDQIDTFYNAESRLYALFKMFAGLAMLISCLGLWGLSTFAAQQRIKEIGIRKVLGASVNTIVMLLSRDFLLLVIVAIVIAAPVSYYMMNGWLQNFAFRISITWQVFAIAGVTSVVIALLTVSVQAIKAALVNPSESLRAE